MNTVPFFLSLLISTSILTQQHVFGMIPEDKDELQFIGFTTSYKIAPLSTSEEKKDTEKDTAIRTNSEDLMTEEQKKASRDLGAVLSSQASSLELLRKIALGTSPTSSRSPSSTKLKGSSDSIVFSKPGSSSAALAISSKEATAGEFFLSSTQKLETMFIEVQSFKGSSACHGKLDKTIELPGKNKITGTECLDELFDFLCATIGSLSTAFPHFALPKDLETYKQFYQTKSKADAFLKTNDETAKNLLPSDTQQDNPLLQELENIFKLKEKITNLNKRLTVMVKPGEITLTEENKDSSSPSSFRLVSPRSPSPSGLTSPRSGSSAITILSRPESPTMSTSPRPSSSKSDEQGKEKKHGTPLRNRSVSVGNSQAPQVLVSPQALRNSNILKRTGTISTKTSSQDTSSSSPSNSPSPSQEVGLESPSKKRTLLGRLRSLSIKKDKDKDVVKKTGSSPVIQPLASSSDVIDKRASLVSSEVDEESSSSAEKKPTSPFSTKRN